MNENGKIKEYYFPILPIESLSLKKKPPLILNIESLAPTSQIFFLKPPKHVSFFYFFHYLFF